MELSKVINGGKEILFVKGILHHIKGNKAPHFAVTGEIWKYNGKTKAGRDMLSGGCLHKEEFKVYVDSLRERWQTEANNVITKYNLKVVHG